MDYNGKISVIGMGNVGQKLVESLYDKRVGRQIYCFGRPGGKSESINARLDEIRDSRQRIGPELMYGRDLEDLCGSDIVIITAGPPRSKDQTRDDIVEGNARVVGEWADYIKDYAPKAVVEVVTNPVAAMTKVALVKTGFLRDRVIGIGSGLDANRVIREFSKLLGLSGSHMRGYVLGDHGENMVIPTECFTIGGTTLENYLTGIGESNKMEDIEREARKMKTASQYLFEGIGKSPWLGPGSHAAQVCEEIYYAPECCDSGTTENVLVELNGEYGIYDTVVGVPVVLGRNGVIKIIELSTLTDEHKSELKQAAEHIRKVSQIALDSL